MSLNCWLLSLLFFSVSMVSSTPSPNTNTTTPSPSNSTTSIAPTASPSAAPTNAPSGTPTATPTASPSNTPTSNSPTVTPTASPTGSPSNAPTSTPTVSPSTEPSTESPTFAPSAFVPFTTSLGPEISVSYQLMVNFTLNFTSDTASAINMDMSLKLAYSSVGIASNYIHNRVRQLEGTAPDNYWFDIFSMIDAGDHDQAANYEKQINQDPDSTSQSKFASDLKLILNANKFDMSIPYFDIAPVASDSGSDNDTTQIIIWFLGVSAVCAIGALLLIICWRKFSGKDDTENDQNAINLEFLLDPNANDANMLTSPMHINEDHREDLNDSLLPQDIENDEDLKPIKKKKKAKQQYFSRLGDDTHDAGYQAHDDDNAVEVDEDDEEEEEEEEHVQVVAEEDGDDIEDDAPQQHDANYEPPNFSRI